MFIAAFVVFVIFAAYAIVLFTYFISFKSQPTFLLETKVTKEFISVIIPFKDEESNIGNLLDDLSRQSINPDNFEIVLVNDHSIDNSELICVDFKSKIKNITIISLPEGITGKKKALQYGILSAKGNLILTTDADCRVGVDWILLFANYFAINNCKLIVGPVLLLKEKGCIHNFFYIEQLCISATTAGSAISGTAIMCSGANLGFEKEVYNETVKDMVFFTPSGDDMFLLMAAKKKWPNKIGYLKSAAATVFTNSERGLGAYIAQRKRWISKSRFYNDTYIIAIALLTVAINLIVAISAISIFFNSKFLFVFIVLYVLKTIIELPLTFTFSNIYNYKKIVWSFLAAQLVYPFFVVFIGIYGKFGKINWKGRLYNS
jgi:poly-beta-1,6-N-acetyl-D-glucosamine synthase